MNENPERTVYGYKTVTPDEKTGLVHSLFKGVAGRYDIMNDLMSGGLPRVWKDRLIRQIRPRPHQRFLDVAGGTGDIAFRLKDSLQRGGKPYDKDITVFDLNEHMLAVGQDRAVDRGWVNGFDWIKGNAEELPFDDNSFDVYTIAFGLRNVTRIDTALSEARRVLKSGGRFFCLEFSHVNAPLLKQIYDAYSFNVIPQIGKHVANDEEGYRYLVESIRTFPTPEDLSMRMGAAGFTRVKHTRLTFGVVAIHEGTVV